MILQLGGWGLGEVLTTPHLKKLRCYEIFHKASDLDWPFGTTQVIERASKIREGN